MTSVYTKNQGDISRHSKVMTQSQRKSYFRWHFFFQVIATTLTVSNCRFDTGRHSICPILHGYIFERRFGPLNTRLYHEKIKNWPQKVQKWRQIFFKMSSIIIIENIKFIDFYPVFWLNLMTSVVGTWLIFCKPVCQNEYSFLLIKLCLHG